LIQNLKNYKRNSIIQETALSYLIHNFSENFEIIEACKLFSLFDSDNDGKISENEFFNGINKISKISKNDVKNIFRNIDTDNNKFIEFEEFVKASIDKKNFLNEDMIKFVFKYFDKDNNGMISYEEIESLFKNSINDKKKILETLKNIIKEADLNGDGYISFDEFRKVMNKIIEK